jgi:hypothetical protein
MNINRNNYEEYFLLYADDELSKAERKMVEVFVKENPEFREEFCMLKITINIPDDEIKLEDKSFLFRNESSFFINKNNYEEVFVLYHDNELSEKEKLETESFLTQHPELKSEFELIGKAKLSPETSIVYPDKKELYRKEKSGKVISIKVWRYVAAAVLIGFGLWVSVPYLSNQHSKTPVVATIKETNNNAAPSVKNTVPGKPKTDKTEEPRLASSKDNSESIHDVKKVRPMRTVLEEKKNNEIVKSAVKIAAPSLSKNIQQLKQEPVEVVALSASKENIQDNSENFQNAIENETKTPVQKPVPEVQPDYAQTASYNEAPATNNDYVFYDVSAEEFKKSKVGGFLKKVKRIVERTNPITRLLDGNDEQPVANKF